MVGGRKSRGVRGRKGSREEFSFMREESRFMRDAMDL